MKNKLELMESAKVSTALLKLGLPTMIGMVVSSLYNLVDTFFVGQLGTLQMAAITVVFPLTLIGTGLGLLFANGGSVFISQMLGKKDFDNVSKYLSTVFVGGLITTAIVITLIMLFFNKIMLAIGATSATLIFVQQYGYLFVIGLIFNVFNLISNNTINTEGATNYSMLVMLLGGILNIILDPIFIFVLKMGIKGAAIATLISRFVSVCFYLYYFLRKTTYLKFSFHNVTFNKEIIGNILKIGVPIMFFQLLNFITLSLVNVIARIFGNDAIAAIGIVNRIFMVETMLIIGFIKGYQPFIAYNYGQNNFERIHSATKTFIKWVTILSIFFAFIVTLFSKQLILAFNNSQQVLYIGDKALWAMALASLFQGYCITYAIYFLSIGKAKQGGFLSICQQGIFFIPLMFLLTYFFELNGLIFTQLITNILTIITTYIIVKKTKITPAKES